MSATTTQGVSRRESTASALSPQAYVDLLAALGVQARQTAERLNLDWSAVMAQHAVGTHSRARQALRIAELGLFDDEWYLSAYSDIRDAGIDPLVVVVHNMPWTFLLAPVGIGALMLAAFAFAWHNLAGKGTASGTSWPARWW